MVVDPDGNPSNRLARVVRAAGDPTNSPAPHTRVRVFFSVENAERAGVPLVIGLTRTRISLAGKEPHACGNELPLFILGDGRL
jgi:hypothetical protein